MKLSTLWLREWVNYSTTEQELADLLTMAGLEVDSISPVAGEFSQVVVAHVLNTKAHPDADKLTLCEVDANTGKPLSVVCGASNVRPGLKVALAMVGANLPDGMQIKETKLRGQISQGMLCSAAELGLAEHADGIIELDEAAPVGVNLREYLLLDDKVFDIDLTPNRADCFSVLGVAREAAALTKVALQTIEIPTVKPEIDTTLAIRLNALEACPYYCGRIIRSIDPHAQTPVWMAERLRRSGIRMVHPVVDILNYVMIELGQPMHAFDLQQIQGDIDVRFGADSEQLELLDGQEIALDNKVLVISDRKGPLAIAGVMGGSASAVELHTQDVFLESAFFNPVTIAGVARQFGIFSDASQRFERGVDPTLQRKALERATGLILAIAGGKAGPIIEHNLDEYLPKPISFPFDPAKVLKLTGVSISVTKIKDLLERLGVTLIEHKNLFIAQIPSHRFDLRQDVDLVEEIIRLHGYDKLPGQPMNTTIQAGVVSVRERIASDLSYWFKGKGYNEAISYSFVDPRLQEILYPHKEFMQLLNPISSELSQMRVGMWPGLIASMIYNIHRQQNAVQFFELGVAFDVVEQQLTERPCLAALLSGERGGLSWNEQTRYYDFYDLKGDVESLFSSLKLTSFSFVSASHDALHPGQSAQILINSKPSGWIGALHPRIADALDIDKEVLLLELDLEPLTAFVPARYKTISKYPQIRRDLSFLIDKQITAQAIEHVVRSTITCDWLKGFDVFDVYMGKGIPEDKKSIAIAITLQDSSRTLVDTEINSLISAIIKALEDEFSILLRD